MLIQASHIMRALGNKITQMSPTRGFATELGAAVIAMPASPLDCPVSTTQCLTGALIGTALMNYDLEAVNWAQLVLVFMGWVVTLPASGLLAGLLCVMALAEDLDRIWSREYLDMYHISEDLEVYLG